MRLAGSSAVTTQGIGNRAAASRVLLSASLALQTPLISRVHWSSRKGALLTDRGVVRGRHCVSGGLPSFSTVVVVGTLEPPPHGNR